ncbi:MAG: aldo/keto reductase [Planctomycetes bacterium]|nr:aldo/keto reductase [Planctomycetota bacterium]
MPRRVLGSTGWSLSTVGFGGIVVVGASQEEANDRIAEAFDRGVNYFDVAPSYGKGEAEEKMGPALKPYRDKVFLACKTGQRLKKEAAEELHLSLKRLKTDHFDLYQLHGIKDVKEDVDRALGPGGAIETFLEAKQKGLVRHIGFSAHSVEAAMKAIESGLFDTILYPVNFVCHYQNGFDSEPLAAAGEKSMGTLALKSMAMTEWPDGTTKETRSVKNTWYKPIEDPAIAALALRWTLGRGVTAALPPGDVNLFRIALNVASKDRPLNAREKKALKLLAKDATPIFPRPEKKPKKNSGPKNQQT